MLFDGSWSWMRNFLLLFDEMGEKLFYFFIFDKMGEKPLFSHEYVFKNNQAGNKDNLLRLKFNLVNKKFN